MLVWSSGRKVQVALVTAVGLVAILVLRFAPGPVGDFLGNELMQEGVFRLHTSYVFEFGGLAVICHSARSARNLPSANDT